MSSRLVGVILGIVIGLGILPQAIPEARSQSSPPSGARGKQPRPAGVRVNVERSRVSIDDGDTLFIRWSDNDQEDVRILGIDTPETRHLEHEIPYAQPFGEEARAFALGALAAADRVEILRAATVDPYRRTLAYVFFDGRNYSTMVIAARLAEETISQFGDNGFPREAADVKAAAKIAGPMAFESPSRYRIRMRELSRWLKERGRYPK
ncbi:MAG TPA: thermonuclease family protein [Vicinamibacterales bacterium]|jgi:endonuclease YncB( thermonuclease family)